MLSGNLAPKTAGIRTCRAISPSLRSSRTIWSVSPWLRSACWYRSWLKLPSAPRNAGSCMISLLIRFSPARRPTRRPNSETATRSSSVSSTWVRPPSSMNCSIDSVGSFACTWRSALSVDWRRSAVVISSSPTTATLLVPERPPKVPVVETSALAKASAIRTRKPIVSARPSFDWKKERKKFIISGLALA